jgi:hypothetical protein
MNCKAGHLCRESRQKLLGPWEIYVLPIALAFLTGCSGGVLVWEVRTESTPRPPSFNPIVFEEVPVAVLEAVSTSTHHGHETSLAYSLERVLAQVAPNWKVVSSQQTTNLINKRGLAALYARMRLDYEQSGILDRESLEKIGSTVGARYVFQPRFGTVDQTMTDRWTLLDVRVTQTRAITLRVSLQLWDTDVGELIWASSSEANMQSEALSQDPVHLEKAVRIAWASIMTDFLNGKTSSKYSPIDKVLDAMIREKVELETPQDRK